MNMENAGAAVQEWLTSTYTVDIPGIGEFWMAGWFLAVIALAAVLLLVVMVVSVRVLTSKRRKSKSKKATAPTPKKKPEKKTKEEFDPDEYVLDNMRKVNAAAPPITAFTPAEYPNGIDPLLYAAQETDSIAEKNKRVEIYRKWCDEQRRLREEQIAARKAYFTSNNFGWLAPETVMAKQNEGKEEVLSAKERREYERIEKDNARRIARAEKLRKQEEAAAAGRGKKGRWVRTAH